MTRARADAILAAMAKTTQLKHDVWTACKLRALNDGCTVQALIDRILREALKLKKS